jgi:hypothetical protein
MWNVDLDRDFSDAGIGLFDPYSDHLIDGKPIKQSTPTVFPSNTGTRWKVF